MDKYLVIVDDGHQYPNGDPGAVISETTEARQNVEVGNELVKRLQAREQIRVLRVPVNFGGQDTIDWVNSVSNKDALVISIHHNASVDPSASGVECYHYLNNVSGMRLSGMICRNISKKLGMKNRGAKTENYSQHKKIGIISKTKGTAVLVECGFLTNEYDRLRILDPQIDDKFAEAIDEAVAEFLGIETVVTPPEQEEPSNSQRIEYVSKKMDIVIKLKEVVNLVNNL